MGETYIKGSITGRSATREYRFLVVEEGDHVGLPQIDIDVLDLKPSMFVPVEPTGDYDRPITGKIYQAGAHFADCYIDLDVLPAAKPTIGRNALRALGYKVDLEQGHIAKPAKPVKIYRGLMPTMLDVSDLESADHAVTGLPEEAPPILPA